MNIEDLINNAAVFQIPSSDDKELIEAVEKNGFETEEAERYVALMPVAFGRVVINQIAKITFSTKYKTDQWSDEFNLTDEPIFMLASELAEKCYKEGVLEKELFSDIATRSAELSAVNKALNAEEDLNGGKFAPVLLFGYKTLGQKKSWLSRVFS